jgi:hypothetical protein
MPRIANESARPWALMAGAKSVAKAAREKITKYFIFIQL